MGPVFVDIVFADLDADPAPGREVYAGRWAFEPGGFAITAITLARLGRPCALATVMGTDPLADVIVGRLADEGVDTSSVVRRDEGTSVTVAVAYRADRSFITRRGLEGAAAWQRSLEAALERGCTHLHVSAFHPDVEAILAAAAAAGRSTSLAVGWNEPQLRSEGLRRCMADATLTAMNEAEALAISGEGDVERAIDALAGRARWLLVTLGPRGSVLAHGERRWRAPASPSRPVDTTGAGDVFAASLLVAAGRGMDEDAALGYAARIAARAVEHLGGAAGVPMERGDGAAVAVSADPTAS